MNQPPASERPPDWRRPPGVAPGTWNYVNERSIADHYDAFVADTPLCKLDQQIVREHFPAVDALSQSVVDLGCGTGRLAIPLARRGYHVIGIDLSHCMLGEMLNKAAGLSRTDGQIDAVQANLANLGCLADNAADHAICMFSTLGMIQGAANRAGVISGAARIVRPGGRFVVHVHNRWAALREPGGGRKLVANWCRSLVSKGFLTTCLRGGKAPTKRVEFGDATYRYRGLNEMFMHRFSRREIARLLEKCGWQVEQLLRVSIDGSKLVSRSQIAGGFVVLARQRGF